MEQTRISSPASQGTHEARAARGTTGKGGMHDGPQAAAPGGFALLLAAQDEVVGAGLPDALAAADAAPAQGPAEASDASAWAAWLTGLPPGVALAERLEALSQAAGGVAGGEAGALIGRLGLGLVRPGQDTLVGQTAWLDGATEAAALNGAPQALALGKGAMARTPQSGEPGSARAGIRMGLSAAAMEAAPERAAPAAAGAPTAAVQAATQVLAAAERREALPAMAPHMARTEGDPAAQGMSAAAMAGAATGVAGGDAGAALRGGDATAAGAGGSPALEPQLPEAADAAAALAEAAQADGAGLEEQMAERVAYWVHQKTQNAELTLDRDGRPVEVKVALTGDEAHITFRSDQAEARDLLDSSTAQLREMLQREGLQLAGVTVGTAGGDGAGPRQGGQEGRQGARQAAVHAAAEGAPAPRRGVTERSVDIFV